MCFFCVSLFQAQVQADAAIDVIYRLIPEAAHSFSVTINVLLPDNSFSVSFVVFPKSSLARESAVINLKV